MRKLIIIHLAHKVGHYSRFFNNVDSKDIWKRLDTAAKSKYKLNPKNCNLIKVN